MKGPEWMPLNVGHYLRDTSHLSVVEHGAYMLLIMRYWQDGGLPDDDALVMRYAHMTEEQWKHSRPILAALFGEGWRHKRIDAELMKAAEIIEKRRAAAEKMHSKQAASAEHMQSSRSDTRVPPSPEHSSSLRSEERAPTPRDHLLTVLDTERAEAVIEMRRRIKAPLTAHGAKLLAADLGKWVDPNVAADEMVSRSWRGFKPEWMTSARAGPAQKVTTLDIGKKLLREMEHANAESSGQIEGHQPPPLRLSTG